MAKTEMFEKDWYVDLRSPSGFGEDRGSYIHSGVDYNHPEHKKYQARLLFDGVPHNLKTDQIKGKKAGKYYGKVVEIRTNPTYAGGVNDNFITQYCHLDKIKPELVSYFREMLEGTVSSLLLLQAGSPVGNIGNTGRCMTVDKTTKQWRYLTPAEQKDPNETAGVHLHMGIYAVAKPQHMTKLLKALIKKKLTSRHMEGTDFFWQWGKIYYRPQILIEYFELLQGKR